MVNYARVISVLIVCTFLASGGPGPSSGPWGAVCGVHAFAIVAGDVRIVGEEGATGRARAVECPDSHSDICVHV